ncbi:hypothetical protein FA95DRAFT_1589494 [Auriscalpium vulgare]|uniref:Uncharacterized protein n=1 Tax=Auriscalpium vulgare TaxID=40419 RepID=A0ACB8RQZ6_9AGAM|nr:hypothetical protein FA95DRAFT_1589494 [Auriscalpium vulgare]
MTPWKPLSLQQLPYDLLLSIAQYLELPDVRALQQTCKFFAYIMRTRPVLRHLALTLLRRCRALPVAGFVRLTDLSTENLIYTVNKAAQLEQGWLTRGPRRSNSSWFFAQPTSCGAKITPDCIGKVTDTNWYKVVGTPPNEDVDWLSPITAAYSLCATKSGKVVCWDVQRNVGLAEWNPGERWELWKCRVEFEQRTVYFTMAKVLRGSQEDKVMDFALLKIRFPECKPDAEQETPKFSHLRTFKTAGMVMNVFLLDPAARLLCGFVFLLGSETIALYVLTDWEVEEYIFVDTDIKCPASTNWSCILHKGDIVIHSEDANFASQYFFSMESLLQHTAISSKSPSFIPRVAGVVRPTRVLSRAFTFPVLPPASYRPAFPPLPLTHIIHVAQPDPPIGPPDGEGGVPITTFPLLPSPPVQGQQPPPMQVHVIQFQPPPPQASPGEPAPNPFPSSSWYPESAHFVRQWWPSLPGVPRLSCTVVLLAQHDARTHATKYVLTQHYFRVPLWEPGEEGTPQDPDDALMRMWYVSEPFEIVSVLDMLDDEEEDEETQADRARPLLAVDFGHAVWIEYVVPVEEGFPPADESKRLRFVSFPSVRLDERGVAVRTDLGRAPGQCGGDGGMFEFEGAVRTLDIPDDLDLDTVETINIDQSQGAVILSVKAGKIYILCYE